VNEHTRMRAFRLLAGANGASCAAIGVTHALTGARLVIGLTDAGVNEDSQERFYGAIFAGYGVAWLSVARQQPVPLPAVRLLAASMAAGGAARLLGMLRSGRPHPFWIAMTGVELAVPAVLVRLAGRDSASPVVSDRR
jgi:Domain of unknown function (DUF4345)